MEIFMKFVSTRMRYGGPSCVLYWKNNAEEYWGLGEKYKEFETLSYILLLIITYSFPQAVSPFQLLTISY